MLALIKAATRNQLLKEASSTLIPRNQKA